DHTAGGRVVYVEVTRPIDTRRNHDCIMTSAERIKADILSDIDIEDEFDPRRAQLINPALYDGLFQLEAGDTIGHQPACTIMAVIDCHLQTGAAQHIGASETARPSADNPDSF